MILLLLLLLYNQSLWHHLACNQPSTLGEQIVAVFIFIYNAYYAINFFPTMAPIPLVISVILVLTPELKK